MPWAAILAAIPAVLQFTSSVIEGVSAEGQKDAYTEYQDKTRQAALEQYRYQTRVLNNRLAEEEEASNLQLEQIQIKNLQAQATAKASAASGGVSGSSIENLFHDYDRASAASNYVATRNLQLKGLQAEEEKEAAYTQAMNTINLQQQYTGGSMATSLLSGVGSGMSMWASGTNNLMNLLNRGK